MIYLDNAATSWPKPEPVVEAMARFLRDVGATPGRSSHRLSNAAERIRLEAREAVAELFGVSDPLRVVFTMNATTALNLVLFGLLPPGSHVVTTGVEHNAVMRPLRALERRGVQVSVVPCAQDGTLDPQTVPRHFRPETRLVVVNHASNVCGTVLPIREIGAAARAAGIPFAVDAAQTAGAWPIDLRRDNIDILVFSGHKGLLGPSGTGGIVFAETFEVDRLPPLIHGGTGSRSEHEVQPDFLPDKYEAGTPNTVGLAGLAAGVRWVLDRGVTWVREREAALVQRLIDGLRAIPGVKVLGTGDARKQASAVAFAVADRRPDALAQVLDEQYEILCRPGLHCAPLAHRTLGTSPHGALRFSPGPFTTVDDVEHALRALRELMDV